MKKDYYRILNVAPGVSASEIEEAYRRAAAVYGPGSAALYSLYTEDERVERLGELSEAYETLADPQRRKAYDMGPGSAPAPGEDEETSEVDMEALRRSIGIVSSSEDVMPRKAANYQRVRFKGPIKAMDDSDQMVAEQYRVLFSNIEQIGLKHSSKVFAITSAIKGEGKSVTSLNLAYVMATEFKKKTLMIECDLRKPSTVAGALDAAPERGLADVLKGEAELHSSILKLDESGLYILPAGNVSVRTSEILGSQRIRNVINAVRAEFDYVIVDSPPVIPLVDMNVISRLVDGVIMVVRAGKTQKDIVLKAVKSLSGCNLVGLVLNGADTKLNKYYY